MGGITTNNQMKKTESRKPYPACKDTGIEWLGGVPSGWPVERLRFHAKINASKSEINGISGDTDVSFVPMEAVCKYGGLKLEQTKTLDEVANGYTYFKDGDVVVAKITPCFENGKGSIAENLENSIGFGTTELHVVCPAEDLNRRFLFYITISRPFRQIGTSYMYGAGGQKRVPDDFIKDFRHPIPPVEEQQIIANFLDRETERIDELIAKKQRQIELLQEKRAALISQAVTKGLNPKAKMKDSGIEWLGEIPGHWTIEHLRRVVKRFVDYRGRTPEKVDGGVPLVTAKNIKRGRIDFSLCEEFIREEEYESWMVRGLPAIGDVLITTEAPLGETAQIVDIGVALAQRIILLKVNVARMTNKYLKYHFMSDFGQGELGSRATGSTAEGIRADRFKGTLVAVPPMDEQKAIGYFLDEKLKNLGKPLSKIESSITYLREYRTALISAAVTGKIDVRKEVA